MKVSKKDVAAVVAATFPEYKGKKFFIQAAATVTLYDLNWCEGTRNQYHASTISGQKIGNGQKLNAVAPWNNQAEGATVQIPQGAVIVCNSIHCGRECGLTVYVNPADMAALLPVAGAA